MNAPQEWGSMDTTPGMALDQCLDRNAAPFEESQQTDFVDGTQFADGNHDADMAIQFRHVDALILQVGFPLLAGGAE